MTYFTILIRVGDIEPIPGVCYNFLKQENQGVAIMAKLIGKIKIVNGKVELIRIGEGEKKLKTGCAYKMYAALRRIKGA